MLLLFFASKFFNRGLNICYLNLEDLDLEDSKIILKELEAL